jgi:hypothetical protein
MTGVLARWTLVAIVIILIWGAWGTIGIHQASILLGGGLDKAGQWGDAFGAINALFGGLAFSGVLATLLLQQRELARQQDQIRKAEREQHLERFDSTFFQLLTLLRDLRAEVRTIHKNTGVELIGAPALRHLYENNLESLTVVLDREQTKETIAASYASSTRMHAENPLGPFFRIVYSILRRISEDPRLDVGERARYGNLVRSHLSSAEVGLIGLNGLTEESNDFSDFITQFRILKYLPHNLLRSELQRFYPAETFAARD